MVDLLAIDTTTDVCSVGLATGDCWLEQTRLAPRLHNQHVLGMIDDVCRAAADQAGEPDPALIKAKVRFIAFGAGPGSFTGVRIGSAVAQGLAFAIGARAIPLPSSAIVAETARAAGRRGICAIRRTSRPGWHYEASYELTDDDVRCLAFDQLKPAAAPAAADSIDGARVAVSAFAIARLALQRTEQAVPPAEALPIYVDGDTPWRPSQPAGARPTAP